MTEEFDNSNDHQEGEEVIHHDDDYRQGEHDLIHHLHDDIILNIFEFLDRHFVLHTLSTCSKHFHQLAHKPYHYSRLLWKFSSFHYEKLDRIKPYYSAVKYIEASDSDRLSEVNIDQSRLLELQTFIGEHQESLVGVEMVFNKNQTLLFDGISEACGDWLSELSISVLLDSEFAKHVCSGLHRFKRLRVLRLFIGKSVDANIVLDSCGTLIESMETFETTLYLYTKEHVEKYSAYAKSLRNISIAINCEVFMNNDKLLQLFISCLQGKSKISFHFFNVPSIAFLNQFREVSIYCREIDIAIVDMKNPGDEELTLRNVQNFRVDFASFVPNSSSFPKDCKTIIFNPSSKFSGNVYSSFDSERFSNLKKLEFSNVDMRANQRLKNLEVIILKKSKVHSIESIIECSEKLRVVNLLDCTFSESSYKYPKRDHLTELVIQLSYPNRDNSKICLSTLQDLKLTTLHLDGFYGNSNDLQHLENMTSLEHVTLFASDREMVKNFKIEKLINLKQFILYCGTNITDLGYTLNYMANPEILKQALILLPPVCAFSCNAPFQFKPTERELDNIIYSAFKEPYLQLRYYIYNDQYIYCVIFGSCYATLVIEHKPPFSIVSKKLFRDSTAPHHTYYTRLTRSIYTPAEPVETKRNCFIM